MSKKTYRDSFRVEVTPFTNRYATFDATESELKISCEQISEQIRRHVDDINPPRVAWDTNHVCEHCNSKWTEDSSDYNGGCCDRDEASAPKSESA